MSRPTQHNITAADNAQIDTSIKKFGFGSFISDGVSDRLDVDADSDFVMGSGDFTLEAWVYPMNTGVGSGDAIIAKWSGGTGYSYGLTYGSGGFSPKANIRALINDTGGIRGVNAGGNPLTPESWNHVALVVESGTLALYANGNRLTTTSVTAFNDASGTKITIGSITNGSYSPAQNMDEVRISTVARYSGTTYTVPTASFENDDDTVLLVHADGVDQSTYFQDDNGVDRRSVKVTALGDAQIDTAKSKFGTASLYLDGTDDRLETDNPIIPASGDWTTEFWVWPTSFGITEFWVAQDTFATDGFYIYQTSAGARMFWRGQFSATTIGSLTSGQWNHIAVVKNGTSVDGYVNGTKGPTTRTVSTNVAQGDVLIIGNRSHGGDLVGHVDELRISSTARYTTSFTPATAAFDNDTDTLLLLHMDGTDTDTFFPDDTEGPSGVTHEGAASLSSAFTQTVSADKILEGASSLSSAFTQTATGDKVISGASTLSSAFTQGVSAERIRSGASSLSSAFTQGVNAVKTVDASSSQSSAATLACTISHIHGADLAAFTNASLTVAISVTRPAASALTSAFTQTATGYNIALPFNRPNPLTSPSSFDATIKKYGSYSAKLANTSIVMRNVTENTAWAPASGQEFAFEGWIYIDADKTITADPALINYGSSTGGTLAPSNMSDYHSSGTIDQSWIIGSTAGGNLQAWVYGDTRYQLVSSQAIPFDTWFHVALTREGTSLKLYYNNTSVANTTYSGAISTPASGKRYVQFSHGYSADNADVYYDHWSFRRGTSDILGYSGANGNTDDTIGLYPFENTSNDDTSPPFTFNGDAQLDGVFTQTATPATTIEGNVSLSSAFTQTIAGGILNEGASALSSAFTQSATGARTRTTDASLSSAFTQSASPSVTRSTSVSVASAFTQTATGALTKGFDASLDVDAFIENAIPSVTRTTDVDLNSAFTQTVSGVRTLEGASSLTAFNTQLTAATKITDALLLADSNFTISLTPSVTRDFASALDSAFTQTADVSSIPSILIIMQSAFSQTSVADRLFGDIGPQLDSAFTQTTLADRLFGDIDPIIDAQFTQTADGVRIRFASASLAAQFTQTVEALDIERTSANLSAQFSLSCTGGLEINGASALTSAFTQTVVTGGVFDNVITLNALNNFTLTYKVIRVDNIVYVVPAESREYKILNEVREYKIPDEV